MLIDGCSLPRRICPRAATVSTAGADQQVWPSIDLGALILRRSAWAPKAERIARSSETSPSGVEVAWAQTKSTSCGATPATFSVWAIVRA